MTEHKFTDAQIIELLKSGIGLGVSTMDIILGSALDLINRQKAEIERLTEERQAISRDIEKALDGMKEVHILYEKDISRAKAEAIKEFAERLKAVYTEDERYDGPNAHTMLIILFAIIDNLVKQMTEEQK